MIIENLSSVSCSKETNSKGFRVNLPTLRRSTLDWIPSRDRLLSAKQNQSNLDRSFRVLRFRLLDHIHRFNKLRLSRKSNLNLSFDGVFFTLSFDGQWGGGGGLILSTIFLLVKTIEKIFFLVW